MADYDTAIADMEAKLEELKQAREAEKVPLLPDVAGFYRASYSVYLRDYAGRWFYCGGLGIMRDSRTVEHMQNVHNDHPLVLQSMVDA